MADTDLYPTPTRLRLLRAVDNGDVYHDTNDTTWWVIADPIADRVTARIEEMRRAGWVEPSQHVDKKWGRRFAVSEPTGRNILKEHTHA